MAADKNIPLSQLISSIDQIDVRKKDGTDVIGDEEKLYRTRAKDFLEKAHKEGTLNEASFKKLFDRISDMLKALQENEWATMEKLEDLKKEMKKLESANTDLDKTNKNLKPEAGTTPVSISAGSISYNQANLNNSVNLSVTGLDGTGNVSGKAGFQNTTKDGKKSLAAEATLGKETNLKVAYGEAFKKRTIVAVALGVTNEKISHDFSTGNKTFNAQQVSGKIALVEIPEGGSLKRMQAFVAGSHSNSVELGTDARVLETGSSYDISDVQKRYAGADVVEFGVGATLDVGKNGELSLGVGYKSTRYDTKFGDANTSGVTGFVEYTHYTQSGNQKYALRLDAAPGGATATARADFSLNKKQGTTAYVGVSQPLSGQGSTRVEFGVTFPLDGSGNPDTKQPVFVRPGRTPGEGNVAAVVKSTMDTLPTSVVGKAEEKTTDVAKVDKGGLDGTTEIDRTTGDLLIDVPGATGIASVTPSSSAFVLEGSKLRVVIRQIAVPPAGSTHNYSVVVNTAGGARTIGVRVSNLNNHLRIEQVSNTVNDTTPDAFTFTDQTGVARSTAIISAPISVAGINAPSPISIVGGEYSTDGGVTWTSAAGTVTNGQQVRVRVTSSAAFATNTDATVTIGGVSDTFTARTLDADTVPDAFTFVDQTGVALSTQIVSNAINVSGITAPANISIVGGEYSTDGGATWTSAAGTVTNGQQVRVRQTSSAANSTTTNTTLTIGGVSDTFSLTTLDAIGAPASAPTGLALTNDSGAADGTTSTSPLAFSWNSVATATGYDISTNGGTSWTSLGNVTSTTVAGLADGTYNIQVRATNAGGTGPATASLPVTLDTLAPSWGSWVSAAPTNQGTTYNGLEASLSETLTGGTLTGVTSSAGGTITGAAINGSGNVTFNFVTPNVANTTLTFTGTDKAGNAFTINRPLVLSAAADTTPDAFTLTDETGRGVNALVSSNTFTVAGINAASPISISGGGTPQYCINGGLWTSAAGNVNPGDSVQVRLTTAATYGTDTTATLTIGGVSETFVVRTLDAPSAAPTGLALTTDSGVAGDNITNASPVNISWNAVAWAAYYEVSYNGGTDWTAVGNVTSADVLSLDGNTYDYRVRAVNAAGPGPNSAALTVTVDRTAPSWGSWISAAPTNQGTTYNGLEVALSESLTGGTLTGITSSDGGTITGAAINGSGNITFNFVTPNTATTIFTFTGTDKAGNAFVVSRIIALM